MKTVPPHGQRTSFAFTHSNALCSGDESVMAQGKAGLGGGSTARPRYLARRHSLPDPALEGMNTSQAAHYKNQAKAEFAGICDELARLREGGFSNYQAAHEILGDRYLESTIRGWRDANEPKRYPREEELDLARAILRVERLRTFSAVA